MFLLVVLLTFVIILLSVIILVLLGKELKSIFPIRIRRSGNSSTYEFDLGASVVEENCSDQTDDDSHESEFHFDNCRMESESHVNNS
jgi:hypothetical protein